MGQIQGSVLPETEIPERKQYLSWSQISEQMRCEYRREKRYGQHLYPRVKKRALSLGSATHLGLAHTILTREKEFTVEEKLTQWAYEQALGLQEEEVGDLTEVVETASSITRRALKEIQIERYETVSYQGEPLCEKRVVIPLEGWDGYVAVFDWVVRDLETGYIWLIDHKVRSRFLPDDSEEVNGQMGSYQYVLKQLGLGDIRGSIVFQIRDSLPALPSLNRDGSMSRARILTDWNTYRSTLLTAGLDPANYMEMQTKLEDVEFFRITPAFRSDREVESIWNKIVIPSAREIKRKKDTYIRALGTFNCNGCEYRTLCLEELRGGDIEFVLKRDFIQPGDALPKLPATIEMEVN